MKFFTKIILMFILTTQILWFTGCTTHSGIRKLSHSVECNDGRKTSLNFQIVEDRLETSLPLK